VSGSRCCSAENLSLRTRWGGGARSLVLRSRAEAASLARSPQCSVSPAPAVSLGAGSVARYVSSSSAPSSRVSCLSVRHTHTARSTHAVSRGSLHSVLSCVVNADARRTRDADEVRFEANARGRLNSDTWFIAKKEKALPLPLSVCASVPVTQPLATTVVQRRRSACGSCRLTPHCRSLHFLIIL
jgi:hypothetical protein